MTSRILRLDLRHGHDAVAARRRARQIAELLGFDGQDHIRIATATSEIVRNALEYGGGGRVEFFVSRSTERQSFEVKITDTGSGIPNLAEVLGESYQSKTGMGLGIVGARRLMDDFEIISAQGTGTSVRLVKRLPAQL